MKRLSMAMTALAVMGLMTMVSCRKPVNQFNTTGEKITFSATTENNSKTYAEEVGGDMYVKWFKGDVISVNGNVFTLVGEGGETSGSFTGNVAEAEGYFASYSATNDGSSVTFTVPASQDNGTNLKGKIPMATYTEEKGGNLAFKNMVNILQLNLTGTQTINTIEVESTEENLSGSFTVGTDLTPNHITSGTKKITVTKNMTLTGTPQTVYVVLPVFGNAESTVTVKFMGDDGEMTVGPKVLTGSTTPNHRYSAGVNVLLETPWSASVVTIPVCAKHATCASSGGVVTGTGVEEQGVCWGTTANPTIADQKYVHQYAYSLSPLKLTPKDETTNNTFTGFMSGLTANKTYHVRAYIKKGSKVVYGDDVTFTTLASEPEIQYVDLGLPSHTLWAKCNLGSTTPEGYGDYYQWGDLAACSTISPGTTYYVSCGWQSYRFAANSTTTFTKYCPSGKTSYWYNYSAGTNDPDGKESLGAVGDHYNYADDCVRQTLGGDWRMPTTAEWKELYDNTTRTWTTSGGVNGWRFTGEGSYTGVSLFLPAAGSRYGTSLYNAGSNGYYWSSSLYSSYPIYAYYMSFGSGRVDPQYYGNRYYGFSVRPVR